MPLPEQVGDAELLASYVLESNKFKSDGIDHRQLMPSKRYGNTSAFRIDGLSAVQSAAIGHTEVAMTRGKLGILGWAVLGVGAVRAAAPLTVARDEPPDRHAVIGAWPQQLHEQRTLALLLAVGVVRTVKHSTVPTVPAIRQGPS